MKTTILALLMLLPAAFADEPIPIEKKLQQALFAEEGARDLDKAIEAYNAVIADYDTQRKFAATAIFRLAECHRKKDQNRQAIAAYQRLLKEFPAEETLARLAQENLAALGADTAEDEAIAEGTSEAAEIARIKKIATLSPDLINDPQTGLLYTAASRSQLAVAKFLIESGADPNLRNSLGESPLDVAVSRGHLAMAKFLLDEGAKLTSTAFTQAAKNKRSAILDLLLKQLPEGQSDLLDGAVSWSARQGRNTDLAKLLARGAKPDELGFALSSQNVESVRMLLEAGAVPNKADVRGAIGLASDPRNLNDPTTAKAGQEIFDLIWKKSDRPTAALVQALKFGNKPLAVQIVNSLKDIEDEAGLGTTPLCYAVIKSEPWLVEAVLDRGADPNARDASGNSPLFLAITTGGKKSEQAEKIDLLLKAGADVNEKLADGDSLIGIVARGGILNGSSLDPHLVSDKATRLLLATNPDTSMLDLNSNRIYSNPLVLRYAALRVADRNERVWLMHTQSTQFSLDVISREAIQLSSIMLDETSLGLQIKLYPPGKFESETIDYDKIIATGDLTKDPRIEPGTIIELTKPDTSGLTSWKALDFLQRAAAKSVTVQHGEHQWKGEARPGKRPNNPYDPSLRIAYATTVKGLLDNIYAPKIFSDLTRVEITHADGETVSLNLLVTDQELRDGDKITLHPIATADTKGSVWISREADLFLYPFPSGIANPQSLGLLELLAAAYSSDDFVLPSPDLEKIRLGKNDQPAISLDELAAAEVDQFPLADGIIVEIPSLSGQESTWTNLDNKTTATLAEQLSRKATFEVVGGTTRELKVGPQFYRFPISKSGLRSRKVLDAPSDDNFDVLGLSAANALRNLGYIPKENLHVDYGIRDFDQGAPDSYNRMRTDRVPPFPIIQPNKHVTIKMSAAAEAKPQRRVRVPREVPRSGPLPTRSTPNPGAATLDSIRRATSSNATPAKPKQSSGRNAPPPSK